MVKEFLNYCYENGFPNFEETTSSGSPVQAYREDLTDNMSIIFGHVFGMGEDPEGDCNFEIMGMVTNGCMLYLFKSNLLGKMFDGSDLAALQRDPKVKLLTFSFRDVLEYVQNAIFEKKAIWYTSALPGADAATNVTNSTLEDDAFKNVLNEHLDEELEVRFIRYMNSFLTTNRTYGFFTKHEIDMEGNLSWECLLARQVFESLLGSSAMHGNLCQSRDAYKARLAKSIQEIRYCNPRIKPYVDIPKMVNGHDIITIDFVDKQGEWHSLRVNDRAFSQNEPVFLGNAFDMSMSASNFFADEKMFNLIKDKLWIDGTVNGKGEKEYKIPWGNIISIRDGMTLLWHNKKPDEDEEMDEY